MIIESKSEEKFYMVYVNGKDSPTVKHGSFDLAKLEADRLARKYPDNNVFVLEAISGSIATTQLISYNIV